MAPGACAWSSIGLGEQGLVWQVMIEPAGGKSVGRRDGTMASCGVGMRVGSAGDVQVVDEMLNSGVPERE